MHPKSTGRHYIRIWQEVLRNGWGRPATCTTPKACCKAKRHSKPMTWPQRTSMKRGVERQHYAAVPSGRRDALAVRVHIIITVVSPSAGEEELAAAEPLEAPATARRSAIPLALRADADVDRQLPAHAGTPRPAGAKEGARRRRGPSSGAGGKLGVRFLSSVGLPADRRSLRK